MIECIFTLDYEIGGNGEGSLRDLVYEPTRELAAIFEKYDARFVVFVEAAELEIIESAGTDPAIDQVKEQIRDLHRGGFEIGLHIHPQWYGARHENGKWLLDYTEYNLCRLSGKRIAQIVDRSIGYLRDTLASVNYTPVSFRAGNWLFQPAETAAAVLAERGVKVDSSVFKGGVRHQHGLDYRRALRNGYYWRFADHADVPSLKGRLLELPIYTQMVPFWKMVAPKRVNAQHIGMGTGSSARMRFSRVMDFLRLKHPLKLDFCSMTIHELKAMVDKVVQEDSRNRGVYKPLVAIGHTKELVDVETVESFLTYLNRQGIASSTLQDALVKCT